MKLLRAFALLGTLVIAACGSTATPPTPLTSDELESMVTRNLAMQLCVQSGRVANMSNTAALMQHEINYTKSRATKENIDKMVAYIQSKWSPEQLASVSNCRIYDLHAAQHANNQSAAAERARLKVQQDAVAAQETAALNAQTSVFRAQSQNTFNTIMARPAQVSCLGLGRSQNCFTY